MQRQLNRSDIRLSRVRICAWCVVLFVNESL
jgi:hypothetical protein